ncbi:MAG: CAP domain-containing protein [Candidatus Pacebacteria bacterium]|nr:CAP domain-containing protein [Candidatus Paceibacterota bacterium]
MKYLLLIALIFILMPWRLVAPELHLPALTDNQGTVEEAAAPAAEEKNAEPVVVQTKPLGAVTPDAPKKTTPAKKVVYTEEYTALLERAIHDRINAERVRAGLGILAYDDALAKVAALHSTDMANENYFDHADENGCTSSCRVDEAGYLWRMVGENLFLLKSTNRYTVEEASAIIVQGWMGSDGHRHNVLEGKFTNEGMGVVILDDAIYATELFALPR